MQVITGAILCGSTHLICQLSLAWFDFCARPLQYTMAPLCSVRLKLEREHPALGGEQQQIAGDLGYANSLRRPFFSRTCLYFLSTPSFPS